MEKRSLTFGEKAVGLTFNPSNNTVVQNIKTQFAAIIDGLNSEASHSTDLEVTDMYQFAIRQAQMAQMWAVKAATWNL